LDEATGSWGQMGTEIACKAHLSGGRLVVNKKTWFAHMFRTQGGTFGFPYEIHGSDQEKARKYSRGVWFGNKWPKAIHNLQWLIDKFAPVPDWPTNTAIRVKKGIVYYTHNELRLKIAHAVQKRLRKIGHKLEIPIVSVSLKPMPHFGEKNVHLKLKRGILTMFRQILAGLEASDAEIIFFAEHDVLYHTSHFDFIPPRRDVFYYNTNVWKLRATDGHAVKVDDCRQTSGLCAYRSLLIEHYRERVKQVEENGFSRKMGFEPGTHGRKERIDDYESETWVSEYPNLDIRHGNNLTHSRWKREEFRNQKYTKGWMETDDEIEGWGKTEDILRFFV
ncbi:hypothetical protein LCGC14_2331500, partial [marine sediment metagenome]